MHSRSQHLQGSSKIGHDEGNRSTIDYDRTRWNLRNHCQSDESSTPVMRSNESPKKLVSLRTSVLIGNHRPLTTVRAGSSYREPESKKIFCTLVTTTEGRLLGRRDIRREGIQSKTRNDVVDHSVMMRGRLRVQNRKCHWLLCIVRSTSLYGGRTGAIQTLVLVPKPTPISESPQAEDLREICRPFDSTIRIFRAGCRSSGI